MFQHKSPARIAVTIGLIASFMGGSATIASATPQNSFQISASETSAPARREVKLSELLSHLSAKGSANLTYYYPIADAKTIVVPNRSKLTTVQDLTRAQSQLVAENRMSFTLGEYRSVNSGLRLSQTFKPVPSFSFEFSLLFSHDFEISVRDDHGENGAFYESSALALWYDSRTGVLYSPQYPNEYGIATPAFQEKMRRLRNAMPSRPVEEQTYYIPGDSGKTLSLFVDEPRLNLDLPRPVPANSDPHAPVAFAIPRSFYDSHKIRITNGTIEAIPFDTSASGIVKALRQAAASSHPDAQTQKPVAATKSNAPLPQIHLTASVVEGHVHLSWNNPSTRARPLVNFTIKYGLVEDHGTVTKNTIPVDFDTSHPATYDDYDPYSGGPITYQIAAPIGSQNVLSNIVTLTIPVPKPQLPVGPKTVRAIGGDGMVLLAWDDPEYSSSYKVYRRNLPDGKFVAVASTTTQSYMDRGSVTNGVPYEYAIAAVNEAGEGALSSVHLVMADVRPSPPVSTSEDILHTALTFYNHVTGQHETTGEVVFPTPDRRECNGPPLDWRRRWLVTIPGAVEIEIADGTHEIDFYVTKERSNDPLAIDEASATTLAKKFATEAGLTSTFDTFRCDKYQPSAEEAAEWSITADRLYQSARVLDSSLLVMLSSNGKLETLNCWESYPDPVASAGGMISEAQANATAQARLKASGIKSIFPGEKADELEVAMPNEKWRVKGDPPLPTECRFIWRCGSYQDRSGDEQKANRFRVPPTMYSTWVDAITGNIVGGEIAAF